MYGVLHIYEDRSNVTLFNDIASAISLFCNINSKKYQKRICYQSNKKIKVVEIKILPNVNNSNALLNKQYENWNIDIEKYHIPIENILNIGVAVFSEEDTITDPIPISILFIPDNSLEKYYLVDEAFYTPETCGICNCIFSKPANHLGFYGSAYLPTYYKIIEFIPDSIYLNAETKEFLQLYNDRRFFLKLYGNYYGYYLAKFPLPENWYYGMFACWNCIDDTKYHIIETI